MQWKRASCRVEAGTSGFLSISDFDGRVPAELEQESQASFGVWREDSGLLFRSCRKEGPHFTMTGASHGFSRAAAPVWVSHEVQWGAQGASHVVPGKSDLHARGEGERVIFLQSW